MATEPDRTIPFEPKKTPKAIQIGANKKIKSNYKPQKAPVNTKNQANKRPFTKEEMALPKVVSDRMARRMVVFCGVPTVLGMATLIAGYIAMTHGIKPPGVLVLLLSMGFLGLSVLGLTYGILSASWDEEATGSKLGVQEFVINWGRMLAAWKSTRQKNV